jgi:putative restriction endonuclease
MFAFRGSVPDLKYRLAAFEWFEARRSEYGDVLPWSLLKKGFQFEGETVHVVSQQGIFKPRQLELPLSLRTAPDGPYDDKWAPDGSIRYAYRGTDPTHRENVAMRRLMNGRVPVIYLFGIVPGRYVPAWPAYIVEDHPAKLQVSVQVDAMDQIRLLDGSSGGEGALSTAEGDDARRTYVTAQVRRRVHQRTFRERVLAAYKSQCALCRFRHEELLDAAHITPDSVDDGEPVVSNGLALCKLHHAAFDRHFLGIRPDFRVEVRPDLLRESDGPTLLHGIQGMHDKRILLPRRKEAQPDPERLYRRFLEFRDRARAS